MTTRAVLGWTSAQCGIMPTLDILPLCLPDASQRLPCKKFLSFTHLQIALDSDFFNSSSPGLCLMRVVHRLAIRVVCFRTYRWRISWFGSSAAGKVLILISLTLKFDQAITIFNTKKHCKRTTPSRLIFSFWVETLAIACLRRSSATSCARPWSWMLPRAAAWFHFDQELRAAD